MGDQNFVGGLLGGLANSLQQQQELSLKKEYQKSLIDINKLHGKLYEAQVNASDLETSVLQNALKKAGILGNAGAQAMPDTAQPGPQAQPMMWGTGAQGPSQPVNPGLPATGPPARDFSDRFLEGYLSKKWGMKPDEVLIKPYGDHVGVFSKQSGTLLGVYPGQGKTVMQNITLPGGAQAVQPMVQPPVPPGPGVPVFGGGQPGLGAQPPQLGQPILTAPRPFKYEQATQPGGAIVQTVVPEKPLPGENFQSGPAKGANSAEAGRMQLAQSGLDAHKQLENLIFDPQTGKSNWKNLAASIGPGVPWTEGKQIKGLIMRSADAIIRAATGAALNQQELEGYAEMYGPSVFDNEATINSKMKGLRTFLNGYLEKMDPTEAARMRVGPIVGPMGQGSFNAPEQSKIPAGAKPTNRTSGGKPVYQLPNGKYWVE